MNTLVVYYSRTGNNKALAEYIKEKYGYDAYEIVTKRKISGFGVFLSLIRKNKPAKIEKCDIDLSRYDNFILISPVWAGCIAKPLITFLVSAQGIKDYSFISACGGENKEEALKAFFEAAGVNAPKNILQLSVSSLLDEQYQKDAMRLMKQRITKEEAEKHFGEKIESFLSK